MLRFIISLALAVSLTPSFSQVSFDSVRAKHIRKYPDHFFIWPVIKRRSLSFDVENTLNPGDALHFKPNNTFAAGVGVYLFDISAELSVSIPLDEKSRSRYGSSDVRDLSATVMGRHWAIDGFVQHYSSFYLSNPVPAIKANQAFPLRPDIDLTNVGGNGIYVFNKKKFSLWSAYNFSERQLKSQGSALIAWTVNTLNMTGDSLVLTQNYINRLKATTNFRDIRYATFSIAPGYSYSLIFRKIFLNASLSIGPAHHWVYYTGSDAKGHYDIAINYFVDSRIALGYNSDRWFGGITFVSQARTVRFQEMQLSTSSESFRMLIGYRLKEKGVLTKTWKDFFPPRWQKYL